VPAIVRWPGKVPAGTAENGILSGLDWFPTLVAVAGNPNVLNELLVGKIGNSTRPVWLQGDRLVRRWHQHGPCSTSEVVSVIQRNSGQMEALLAAVREKNATNGILR
jgi:hypothetical protein